MIIWDPNETIDIGEWSICGGGRLEVLLCMNPQKMNLSKQVERKFDSTTISLRRWSVREVLLYIYLYIY